MARKRAPAVEEAPIEILEDSGKEGLGLDFGIILATTLLLLGGVIVTMMALGEHYGRGPFGG